MDCLKKEGFVVGGPRWILRLEGFLIFCLIWLSCYNLIDFSWFTCLILFFLPDLSLIAYLFGKKPGAFCYNFMHSYNSPMVVGFIVLGLLSRGVYLVPILIWVSHIALDRALGFGLKYSEGFKYTHLGLIGKIKKVI